MWRSMNFSYRLFWYIVVLAIPALDLKLVIGAHLDVLHLLGIILKSVSVLCEVYRLVCVVLYEVRSLVASWAYWGPFRRNSVGFVRWPVLNIRGSYGCEIWTLTCETQTGKSVSCTNMSCRLFVCRSACSLNILKFIVVNDLFLATKSLPLKFLGC